ncbi:hypothetical protein DFA_01592 [Cavenderia fasciculata]|uniref:4'-phosphopantetheinyl transferase domain-containing protein n=1 Tax=Cavenderia fasciculata TaxID=261658 RepID=F4PTN6_CACFS|nr:uncharacterized protein DFA_01592 [Cavenderia fasciculata]EGG21706.1 hypothetical protein DFA_01592 [Cavenderia fasciculata]|eukprot:XP_004359556.1 hypothetical protein DFA_01592 [Cavenderia fasciculata]
MSKVLYKIYGIGNDIVKISRFSKNSDNERFLRRAFHQQEIDRFYHLKTVNQEKALQYLAGRWAAKESVYKAFRGIDRSRLPFPNIKIASRDDGSPVVELQDSTMELANQLNIANIHLSISHDEDYAIANVILEEKLILDQQHQQRQTDHCFITDDIGNNSRSK